MKLSIDLEFLGRIDSQLPYRTEDLSEIEAIAYFARHKLIDVLLSAETQAAAGAAVVHRMRPRGMAALMNGGDTLI
jgi:hypothetical protein